MKISVIVAVYNHGGLLKKALCALKQQSMQPDELILTDDGSDEDIPAAVHDVVLRLRCPVMFVSQPHEGFRLARCRNNGARHANGDYLVFLDQDIVVPRNFLELMVEHRQARQFCVGYPVRLTERQSEILTEEGIDKGYVLGVVTRAQELQVKRQYLKDNVYCVLKRLRLRRIGPKLRGGVVAINRDDFVRVNGYDENYRGWGNEDDDLGRRLYAAGVKGKNPFWSVYPLHLFHPAYHQGGLRVNLAYYRLRVRAIERGEVWAPLGLDNTSDGESITAVRLN